jgi:hypothetical protein
MFGVFKSRRKDMSQQNQDSILNFIYWMGNLTPIDKYHQDIYQEITSTEEGTDLNSFGKKPQNFHVLPPQYYFQRVIMIEAEIADMVRRRMVPDAKHKLGSEVNTYNTFSMDVNEFQCLIRHLSNSAAPFAAEEKKVRVEDRGKEAGSVRRGKIKKYTWKNDPLNGTHLPVLDLDPMWFISKWVHKKKMWMAMVLEFSITYKFEEHRARIEFQYYIQEKIKNHWKVC